MHPFMDTAYKTLHSDMTFLSVDANMGGIFVKANCSLPNFHRHDFSPLWIRKINELRQFLMKNRDHIFKSDMVLFQFCCESGYLNDSHVKTGQAACWNDVGSLHYGGECGYLDYSYVITACCTS